MKEGRKEGRLTSPGCKVKSSSDPGAAAGSVELTLENGYSATKRRASGFAGPLRPMTMVGILPCQQRKEYGWSVIEKEYGWSKIEGK